MKSGKAKENPASREDGEVYRASTEGEKREECA